MKVTRFDPTRDLIIVDARLWGRRTDASLTLAIDTGSSETKVRSADGLIRVARVAS